MDGSIWNDSVMQHLHVGGWGVGHVGGMCAQEACTCELVRVEEGRACKSVVKAQCGKGICGFGVVGTDFVFAGVVCC
jgi:hypothetical protein